MRFLSALKATCDLHRCRALFRSHQHGPAIETEVPVKEIVRHTMQLTEGRSHNSANAGLQGCNWRISRVLWTDIASYVLVVDAKDATAARFCQRYRFSFLVEGSRRSFIPMPSVASLTSVLPTPRDQSAPPPL
jgi:hypothetical protein